MPNVYEIEQYEICVTKYRVQAASEAEAIAKLFDGGADAVDNSHEYIEIAENCGLPADEHQELAAELRSIGVPVDEIVPSIRSVEQVD
jgi:hypothetical protein